MSYIQTVKISDVITNSTDDIVLMTNAVKNITGWTTFEGTNKFQIGKFNRMNIEFTLESGTYRYNTFSSSNNYYPDPSNPSSDVGETSKGTLFTYSGSSYADYNIYLHYCKSASGKTIAIGFTMNADNSEPVPKIDFIVAEDDKGDVSTILFTNNSNRLEMVCNGYWCYGTGTSASLTSPSTHFEYAMTGSKTLSTSLYKMPNFLNGCMFTDLYGIASCPIEPKMLYTTVFDIDGKRYQGVNGNSNGVSSFAILVG